MLDIHRVPSRSATEFFFLPLYFFHPPPKSKGAWGRETLKKSSLTPIRNALKWPSDFACECVPVISVFRTFGYITDHFRCHRAINIPLFRFAIQATAPRHCQDAHERNCSCSNLPYALFFSRNDKLFAVSCVPLCSVDEKRPFLHVGFELVSSHEKPLSCV